MLISYTVKDSYYKSFYAACLCLFCLLARAQEPSAEAIRTEPAAALSSSLWQLRSELTSADAATTVQALQGWAAQNHSELAAARASLQEQAEADQAHRQRLQAAAIAGPDAEVRLSANEQALVELRAALATAHQAALAGVDPEDPRAKRDVLSRWRHENLNTVAAIAAQEAAVKADDEQERLRLYGTSNLLEAAGRIHAEAVAPAELSPSQSRLAELRQQWCAACTAVLQRTEPATVQERRDALSRLRRQHRATLNEIAALEVAEGAAARTRQQAALQAPIDQAGALSPAQSLRLEARLIWHQGYERVLAELSENATAADKRDALVRYRHQTQSLRAVFE